MLAEMAARDGLTGIYNRRRFDEHMETVWQQAQRDGVTLALLLVDIDFFKRFNDKNGHQAGDECLRMVATALARAARRPLDFVARYGGEEFAVILYDPSRQYLQEIANRIHTNVASLGIEHGDSSVAPAVTVSAGIAYVAPTLERSTQGFVQLADEALYQAATTAAIDRCSARRRTSRSRPARSARPGKRPPASGRPGDAATRSRQPGNASVDGDPIAGARTPRRPASVHVENAAPRSPRPEAMAARAGFRQPERSAAHGRPRL